jgi:hypothetical protein
MTFVPRGLLAAQNLIDGPHCTVQYWTNKNVFLSPLKKHKQRSDEFSSQNTLLIFVTN